MTTTTSESAFRLTGLPTIASYTGTPVFMIQRPSLAVSDLGYSFDFNTCNGDPSTCQSACGTTYEPCWHETENWGTQGNWTVCYNPSMGEVCCGDVKGKHVGGAVCGRDYYCVEDVNSYAGGLFCCKEGLSLDDCNTSVIRSVVSETAGAQRTALRVAGGVTGTSSASVGTSSPSNSFASSPGTGMSTQEKIGISLGVIFGVALLALGAFILWHKRRHRSQKEVEVVEESKQIPPLEVDADGSALTREQYNKRVAVELNGVITAQELESRESPVELDATRLRRENRHNARLADSS